MRVLDLFSGIGGFSLGLERAGMKTVAFCEIEEYPRRVLAKHWPGVEIMEDVRDVDGKRFRGAVELICGGYPCQPFSTAGKRRGQEDDRHLWPEVYRLLQEIGPVGSLVRMLLGTSRWGSTRCYLTWRAQATPHSRLLFRLSPSMPPIAETGFGLWQTPVADDAVEREKGKWNSRGEPKLSAQVKLWPTPTSSDGKEYSGNMEYFKKRANVAPMLPVIVGLTGEETAEGMLGKLNPQWVEWLMGFPPGWTDLDA